jgi:hypothetical protein
MSRFKTHNTWTDNPVSRAALWSNMGGYMYSGIMEFNRASCPPPTVVTPTGVATKSSSILTVWLVSDARRGNLSLVNLHEHFTTVTSQMQRIYHGDFGIDSDISDA